MQIAQAFRVCETCPIDFPRKARRFRQTSIFTSTARISQTKVVNFIVLFKERSLEDTIATLSGRGYVVTSIIRGTYLH